MTIEEMRALVGLPEDATDAEVVAAYVEMFGPSEAAAEPDEPITLEEAKLQLRLDVDADDAAVTGYIIAAREWVESWTYLVLVRREISESIPAFSRRTALRAWPIAADQPLTLSYRDGSGAEQTIENAVFRAAVEPALVFPAAGTLWPSASLVDGAITATFTAGFATPAEVPQLVKQAMLILITAYEADREGGEIFARAEASAKSLCRKSRRRTL